MHKELSESEVITTVRDIRGQAPGIGAYKLFVMLRELYPEEMKGRDWFYRLMHENHLMLKPLRRRRECKINCVRLQQNSSITRLFYDVKRSN